jgi:ketosteroid isomerase-like protein
MAHPNEAVVLRFLEALPKRDLETIEELLADDVVWHWAGRGPLSGEYRGKDRFSEFSASLGRMIGEPGAKHRVELHDIVANDEHTIVLWTRIAERGAATLESPGVGVYHLLDGKITEVWVVHEDQHAADEFFS